MFQSLQTFINRSLRSIFKIFGPETISNEHLWQMAREKPIIQQIKERNWQWIGQTLRKDPQAIERQVLKGALKNDVIEEGLKTRRTVGE
jgi:hypothetical protein